MLGRPTLAPLSRSGLSNYLTSSASLLFYTPPLRKDHYFEALRTCHPTVGPLSLPLFVYTLFPPNFLLSLPFFGSQPFGSFNEGPYLSTLYQNHTASPPRSYSSSLLFFIRSDASRRSHQHFSSHILGYSLSHSFPKNP